MIFMEHSLINLRNESSRHDDASDFAREMIFLLNVRSKLKKWGWLIVALDVSVAFDI